VLGQGEFAFAVFDQKIFDIAAMEEEFMELVHYGGIKKADRVSDLAALLELDAAELESTIADYNAAASCRRADALGRKNFGLSPLEGPFYGCRVVPGLFHTQGGLRVDANARVLKPDGTPIPGLFAGGGAAAGISGKQGALGYASGNGLLTAIALGRLAGMTAAEEVREVAA
jgi:fumarate reductase flavoprotein subunit